VSRGLPRAHRRRAHHRRARHAGRDGSEELAERNPLMPSLMKLVMRSAWRLHLVFMLVATAAIAGCRRSDAYRQPLPVVRVQTVAEADRGGVLRFSGRVDAQMQVNLAFRVAGYVDSIASLTTADGARRLVQAGDPVRRGAILAVVRQSDYARKYDELR